jgi:hypothetical protein
MMARQFSLVGTGLILAAGPEKPFDSQANVSRLAA